MRLALAVLVAFAVAAQGCGGTCDRRNGSYIVDFGKRDGSCPDIPEQIVGSWEQAGPGCTGANVETADHCKVTMDSTCSGSGGVIRVKGAVDWDGDGSEGRGVVSVDAQTSGGATCHGTYNITYRKQ